MHSVRAVCTRPSWNVTWEAARPRIRVAAAGPGTAARLIGFGVSVAATAEPGGARALAATLETTIASLTGMRILWPRADLASLDFRDRLTTRGADVVAPIAYRTQAVPTAELAPLVAALSDGSVQGLTFFSPSSANSLARAFGGTLSGLAGQVTLAAIGPTTAEALALLGAPADVVAPVPTVGGPGQSARATLRAIWSNCVSFPTTRPRRLRQSDALRRLVRETRLSPEQLVAPLFVCDGEGVRQAIAAMPGCSRMSVDVLVDECRELAGLGIPAVMLFGIPIGQGSRRRRRGRSAGPGGTRAGGHSTGGARVVAVGRRLPVRVHGPWALWPAGNLAAWRSRRRQRSRAAAPGERRVRLRAGRRRRGRAFGHDGWPHRRHPDGP